MIACTSIGTRMEMALSLTPLLLGTWLSSAQCATYDVSGRVLGPDGRPIVGAKVYHYRHSDRRPRDRGIRATTVTGQGGAFELKDVTVSHGGCVYDALLAVAPGFGFAYWSAPTRADQGEPVVLKLAEERVLKGILLDQSGKAVLGGAVVVSSMSYRTDPNEKRVFANLAPPDLFPELAVQTNNRGRFEIPNLPNVGEGRVLLEARHGALAACRKTVQVKDFGTQVKLTLESRGAIEGRVTYAETGAPAAGVVVVAGPKGRLDGGDKAATGKNGRYSIEGVRAGEYRIQIAKENTIEWTASAKSGVKVTAGRATEGVDLALVKGGVISGEVVESGTGKPVAGVWVHMYAASVDYLVTTELDGTFRLRCPPEGYGVRLLRAPEGYPSPDGSEAHSVTVRDEEDVSVRPFEMAKGLTFVGRVVGPQGKPVSSARVSMARSGSTYAVTTDAQGRFRLRDLEPNSRHAIRAQCTKTGLSAGAVIEVPARSPDGPAIKLLPHATVVGRVVDVQGNPVEGHPVRTAEMLGEFCVHGRHANTGKGGRYRFSATAGTRLCVQANAQRDRSEPPAIAVVAGEHYEMPDIIVRPLRTIAGRVIDPSGKPVPGARVTMRFGWQPFDTATDAQGAFKFEKIERRGDHVTFLARNAEGTLAGQAEIEASRASDDIVLQLVRAASVAGRMVDADGKPIPGALAAVSVVVKTRDIWSTVVARARADAQGRYCIRGLVPHPRGFVMGSAQGYASADSKERALEAGKTLEIEDLVLGRADSFVAGTVTDLDGKPLVGAPVSCNRSSQFGVQTNSQGKYRLDGVPRADDLRIEVHQPGYHSDRRSRVKAGSTDVNFKLTPKSQPTPGAVATVGKPVPEPTVETWLNRASLKLTDLRDKVVVIHFWTLYSRPCVRSMHALLALHEQYPDDLAIVAIHDRAAAAKEVREFVEENEVKFPVGIVKSTKDDGWAGKTFRAFGVKSLPATFLVDRKGILRKTNVTDDLAAQVKALIAE